MKGRWRGGGVGSWGERGGNGCGAVLGDHDDFICGRVMRSEAQFVGAELRYTCLELTIKWSLSNFFSNRSRGRHNGGPPCHVQIFFMNSETEVNGEPLATM